MDQWERVSRSVHFLWGHVVRHPGAPSGGPGGLERALLVADGAGLVGGERGTGAIAHSWFLCRASPVVTLWSMAPGRIQNINIDQTPLKDKHPTRKFKLLKTEIHGCAFHAGRNLTAHLRKLVRHHGFNIVSWPSWPPLLTCPPLLRLVMPRGLTLQHAHGQS